VSSSYKDLSGAPSNEAEPLSSQAPSFGEAARFWIKLGFINFGGPAGLGLIYHLLF